MGRKTLSTVFLSIWLIVLASGLLPMTIVSAQEPRWSTPIQLGDDWFPDIAVDSTGAIHVVWASGEAPYDQVMYTYSVDGREWSRPNDIHALFSSTRRDATRPAILADPSGLLHITFRGEALWYSNGPILDATNASRWRTPHFVESDAYFSKLALDSKQRLHLFFTVNRPRPGCANCFHLMYHRSDDGVVWSPIHDITPHQDGVAKPQVVLDSQDNLYLVFEAGYGGDLGQLADPAGVMYMASMDGGDTWTVPISMAPDRGTSYSAQARNISIGIGKQQELVVVWWAIPDDVVYYQVSRDKGETWSRAQPVPGVWGTWAVYNARLDDYSMATDSAGTVHLVMSGRTQATETNLSLLHLEWNGDQWSSPDKIITLEGDVPEWPRIAVGNGNQLHVVWFVRNQAGIWDSDNGNYTVWYAHSTSAAPYIEPAPLPVVQPTPVEQSDTEALTTVSDPTAVASLPPHLQAVESQTASLHSLKTESDDVLLLVKSVTPALLLTSIIVLAIHLFHKHDE